MSSQHRVHTRYESEPSVYASGDETTDHADLVDRLAHEKDFIPHVDSDEDSAYGSEDQAQDHLLPTRSRRDYGHANEDEAESLQTARAQLQVNESVSWMSLPRKDQLIILTIIRFAEPITQTSLQAYMFYMLRSFDESLSDSDIAAQLGLLAAGFTGAQAVTAMIWGGLADQEWMGRKRVLLIGLSGTIFSTIGFGLSKSFFWAMLFRTIGGALNGDVGIMRTMISEIVIERKFQSKAFLLMPFTFNIGILIGPMLGGWLQDPVGQYPGLFPKGGWLERFPYALPNVVTSVFLLVALLLVFFGLEETHYERKHRKDWGLNIGRSVGRSFLRLCTGRHRSSYTWVGGESVDALELGSPETQEGKTITHAKRPQLPRKQMFTKNVVLTLCTHGLFALHLGVFGTLWFLFLSTPRFNAASPKPPEHTEQRLPFSFTGGLGLLPPDIGMALSVVGIFGLLMQFSIYTRVTDLLGVLKTYRLSNMVFPVTYLFVPFLVMLPTRSQAPHPADGPWLWLGILCLLAVQNMGRTFALPITQILINNCTPHPSVLGTMHGIGSSISAATRTLGPVLWTLIYGYGLEIGKVGLAWWTLAVAAMLVPVLAQLIYEGSGHEIRVEGDPPI